MTKGGKPVTKLEHGLWGRPLLLGDLDSEVQQYMRKFQLAGGIVNRTTVIAAATGIALLRVHGGPIQLAKNGLILFWEEWGW